jgi:hypothetical protein
LRRRRKDDRDETIADTTADLAGEAERETLQDHRQLLRAEPGAVDTVEHLDRWQYRSWQEFLDSLAAEGYHIDSVTFETRGPI